MYDEKLQTVNLLKELTYRLGKVPSHSEAIMRLLLNN